MTNNRLRDPLVSTPAGPATLEGVLEFPEAAFGVMASSRGSVRRA